VTRKKPLLKPTKKTVKKQGEGIPSPWYLRKKVIFFLLIAIPLVVYIKVVTLDFTMLDDAIFIRENQPFNSDIHNLSTAFQRGVFSPANDFYYRPVFLVDFILESQFFGVNIAGYHFTNLLYHLVCVLLLYLFLRKLKIPEPHALLLGLIFAVHPVLSQAVAWIPGRNDMLLMIFFLSGLILTLDYARQSRWYLFLGQFACFLLALFTKETAVIIPLVALPLLIFVFHAKWKTWLLLTISWGGGILFWALIRSMAPLIKLNTTFWELMQNGIHRVPAAFQYLGKILFPFNLAVFPSIDHITLFWGILAAIFLVCLIVISKSYFKPLTIIGLLWFILFLVPVLVVPPSLNDQVFEHRLYIPMIGILLILSQTLLFQSSWKENNRLLLGGVVILLFCIMTFIRLDLFKTPLTFWTRAVDDNPTSAYARMMLGLRMTDTLEMKRRFDEAYQLNPDEKMLNYLIGKLALDGHQVDKAALHLKRELKHSQIPDNYFYLARVYFIKNNLDSAAYCLEKLIALDPLHPQGNNNLALLYYQLNRKKEAWKVLEAMRLKGMEIPKNLSELIKKPE
jgi:4-amino-4-deoxy-L-arabinose transferase-like glycosyltransferase